VSRQDCVIDERATYLNMLKRVANCKIYTKYCSAHPYKKKILGTYCTVQRNLTAGFGKIDVTVNCV
jgi:hypothetical protein